MRASFNAERFEKDHVLIACVILLAGLGLVTLYSSSYAFAQNRFISRQLVLCAVGIVLFCMASVINLELLRKIIKPMVMFAFVLCILTFVPGIGLNINGASRWIEIGGFSYQPSELVKLVLPLYLAHLFEKKKENIDSVIRGLIPPALITGAFFTVIFFQNNFSTAAFLAVNALFMFYFAGVKFRYLVCAVLMFVPISILMVLEKEHRVRRFLSYIQPGFEPQGASYQVIASMDSISSGGFWGKGIGYGTREPSSVPEIHSDFIFSSYAEESGFLGVILFCLLFALFAIRGYMLSMSNEKTFNRLLGVGLVTMIISQVLLNIGVAAGALPATGVPLPFFSAGGSSLVTTLMMSGLIVNVSRVLKRED